ncbi:hypothetical protein [Sulfurivirga sp.]|uniref:hypothetical protein n=1 Tax=Sulfurivirga sp. TaxID=2614236 RepID=UPI0025E7CF7C|nr:hypothetical protein [Sulfurivirga sp.]
MGGKKRKEQPRQCDGCTACCDGWVRIDVPGYEAWPGHPCPYSTGSGCADYDNRPEFPCRRFVCGWLLPDSPLPDWMKPDKAKVMVLFNQLQWQGLPVDVALPVGKRIPPRALRWLQQFAEQHGRPLIWTECIEENGQLQKDQMVYAWGPPAFQQQVQLWQEQGVRLW